MLEQKLNFYKRYISNNFAISLRFDRLATIFLFMLVLATGTWLRVTNLEKRLLWIDEAESAINALTILQHGVPVDHYLGMPIYENALIRKWPESDEYEFKDISYSNLGVSIYHGWLPLYSMAASFALFGISPDEPASSPSVVHTEEEMSRRTIAPRLPSIIFSILFLMLLFQLGRELGGIEVAWTALIAGSFASGCVYFGSQARYYALTLLLVVACGLMLWRMIKRGRWQEYILGGICLVLLFHTHILACTVMIILIILFSPMMRHHRYFLGKTATVALILGMGTVPWIILTGYLEALEKIPRAWKILDFPACFWSYLSTRVDLVIFFSILLLYSSLAAVFRTHLPQRIWHPFMRHRVVYLLLLTWIIVAYTLFMFAIPSASFFLKRLVLLYVVPGILLATLTLTDICYGLAPRKAIILAPTMIIIFLMITGRLISQGQQNKYQKNKIQYLIKYLQKQQFEPLTNLYTSPNNHLVLQYYTGLPIQSIAPVHKSFLDTYEGTIVFIENFRYMVLPDWRLIKKGAESDCAVEYLSELQAKEWAKLFWIRMVQEKLLDKVSEIEPELKKIPYCLDRQRVAIESNQALWTKESHKRFLSRFPMLSDPLMGEPNQWWQTFFYQFVDPDSRSGSNSNYMARLRRAKAVVLSDARYVIYYSPAIKDYSIKITNEE